MKKGPELMMVIVMVFVIGSIMTGVSQSDIQFAALVEQVFNNS